MEMLDSAVRLLTKDCFMGSIDFKYTPYSVPIHDVYQRYLKFKFDDGLFCFTAFANGLAPCRRLFTKLMKPVLADLGKRGILITGFTDDKILIMKAVWTVSLTQYHWQTQWGLLCTPTNPVSWNQLKRLCTWVLSQIRGRWLKLTPERVKKIRLACNYLFKNYEGGS